MRYDEYVRRNREKFTRIRLRLRPTRLPRRRPRDPEEERVLIKLAKAKRERWLREGKLQILGERHYRLRL